MEKEKGKEKICGNCVSMLINTGLRLREIRKLHPEHTCLFNSIDTNNQLNVKSHYLSLQNVKFLLTPNAFRHAYVTSNFRHMHDIKSTLGHQSIKMTDKYIKKQ